MHSIPKPIAVVVCYPSNPTAMVASLDFYKDLVLFAKKHEIFVLSDLAYAEVYFDDEPPPSILQAPGAFDVAVEFTSMSKTFSMAGWRIGFAVGNERLLAALARVKSYLDYGAYTPIQVAAAAALNGPDDCIKEMRATYKRRRDVMVESFAAAGWAIDKPSASMFAWTPVPEKIPPSRQPRVLQAADREGRRRGRAGHRLRRARRRLRAPRAGRERAAHPPGRARRAALLRDRRRDAAQRGEAEEAGVEMNKPVLRGSAPAPAPTGDARREPLVMQSATLIAFMAPGRGPGLRGSDMAAGLIRRFLDARAEKSAKRDEFRKRFDEFLR